MLPFIKNILESMTLPLEQCSGSVGIERLMMAAQLCPPQGRDTEVTITSSGWKRDYLCWLLFPKHWGRKNQFPLVSLLFRYSIPHLFSGLLQHCAG